MRYETHILAIVGFLIAVSTFGHTKGKRTKPNRPRHGRKNNNVSASAFSNK